MPALNKIINTFNGEEVDTNRKRQKKPRIQFLKKNERKESGEVETKSQRTNARN